MSANPLLAAGMTGPRSLAANESVGQLHSWERHIEAESPTATLCTTITDLIICETRDKRGLRQEKYTENIIFSIFLC